MKQEWHQQQQQITLEVLHKYSDGTEKTDVVASQQHSHDSEDGEQPMSKKPSKLPPVEFSMDQEEELIQWLWGNSISYDQSHPDSKDQAKKDQLLERNGA